MLSLRTFRALWVAKAAYLLGSRFTLLVVPWMVLRNTHSPWDVGLVVAASQFPALILSLPVSAWIELRNKQCVGVIASLSRGVVVGVLITMVLTGTTFVSGVLVLMLLIGATEAFFNDAYSPLFVLVVGRESLDRAYSLTEIADAGTLLIGPALAGWLFTVLGPGVALGVDLLTAFVAAWAIGTLRVVEPPVQRSRQAVNLGFYAKQIASGIAHIVQHPTLRTLMALAVTLSLVATVVPLMLLILAKQTLRVDALNVGILFSVMGIGDLAGMLVLRYMSWTWRTRMTIALGVVGVATLGLIEASSLGAAMIAAFVLDGALSIAFVVHVSTVQVYAPDQLLTRINGARQFIENTTRVAASIGFGGVAQYLGIPMGLVVVALFVGANVVWLGFTRLQN